MDISATDILYYTNINVKDQKDNVSNLLSKENDMNDLEYVKKTKPCVISKDILGHLDSLRESDLLELYNDQFYDIGFMSYLTDLTCPIFYPVDGEQNTTFVKTWLNSFRKIGEASAEGIAIEGSITNKKDGLFVIKAPRKHDDKLAHEAVVGYALAPLRAVIPNFSWVYGVLRCSIPVLTGPKDDIKTWCSDTDPVTYVVYEKIPGVNLRKYMASCTGAEYLNAILQIIYSLVVAEMYCGFTHYDLHYENIIMRPLTEMSDIIYDVGNHKIALSTRHIATFIDYGFSRVEFDGRTSGRYGFESFSIFGDRSYLMFDIFKLVSFCCLEATKKEYECKHIAKELLRFFTYDDIPTFLHQVGYGNGILFSLPYQIGNEINISDFISYIYEKFNPGFLKYPEQIPPGELVLNCEYQKCMTSNELDAILHIDSNDDYKDIQSYYIAMKNNIVNDRQRHVFREKIKREYIKTYYDVLRQKLKRLDELIKTTPITMAFNNPNIAIVNAKNQRILIEYRKYIEKVIAIVSEYNDIKNMFDILIEVSQDLSLRHDDIEESRENFVLSSKRKILEYIDNIKKNVASLSGSNIKDKWYSNILPTYISSLTLSI